jgi:hypothetical protein
MDAGNIVHQQCSNQSAFADSLLTPSVALKQQDSAQHRKSFPDPAMAQTLAESHAMEVPWQHQTQPWLSIKASGIHGKEFFALSPAAAATAAAAAAAAAASRVCLQDKAASDSLEGASALVSLGLLMRNAVDLLRGMHISIDGGVLSVAVFSLIEWFTVRERQQQRHSIDLIYSSI